ncbi:hypothetical protein [Virgibacillus sp. DJP39]|uniref:hypothetical protein n=1 Tax=Virgibacillus sp. DJP39 TaxID=3409790 RepID=UPI003BB7B673
MNNFTAMQITDMVKMGMKTEMMVQFLQSKIEFPSMDFVKQLLEKLMDLNNDTRLWVLKGNSPDELSQQKKSTLTQL